LPGGLLSNTSIPLIILVLNKSKQLRGAVNMIDATSFVVENKPNESVLNDDLLQSFIQTNSIDEDIIRIVENNTIRENDYNLNVTRYFVNHIVLLENEKLVELGDIVELVRGQRGNLPEKGKLVRIGDLKDDVIDFTIDVSKVEELELKRQDIKFLTESCLLFAMVGKKLKPTSFKFINEPILLGPNILSFKIKVSKTKNVDLSYLINELHADYVQEQINNFLTGAAIPFLRKDDLLRVRIKLPILAEQKAKVEGVKQAFIKAKEDELLLHREILGIKEDAFKEFASIKHQTCKLQACHSKQQ
jgi:type I restriction enzyme M protein